MSQTLYVYNGHAYTNELALFRGERARLRDARTVPVLGGLPKLVYRVLFPGLDRLVTDPVEVCHLTQGHDEAEVEVIPVLG
ncbi:MAG: hypothetical protein QNJ94_04010 [Alphaproteobacteria bacterium]|nr:hypothetical protein [Alphaproteobacteria bacterium]